MEVKVGTLLLSNDKSNVLSVLRCIKNVLSYFSCLSSKFEV